jgi:hypothetical protein
MTFLTELRKLEAKATAPVDSTASFCDVGESNQKLALFLRNHAKEIINLVEAAEMLNEFPNTGPATSALSKALAALNKEPIDPNKWAFDRGLESY